MRYLIYMRVSTDKQDEEMQRHHCMNYINGCNKSNAPVVIYSDPDVSSRVQMSKRMGLQDMLKNVLENDVLVTFKLDRLSRDIIEMVTIYRMIIARKAQVYSLGEPNIEAWMLGIFASIAQKERENISERTKAKLAEKKAKGERLGRVPYGLTLDEYGNLAINVQEASLIKIMHEYRYDKRMTFRAIANALNAEGYRNRPTKKRSEVLWTHGATARIHKNIHLCEVAPAFS